MQDRLEDDVVQMLHVGRYTYRRGVDMGEVRRDKDQATDD